MDEGSSYVLCPGETESGKRCNARIDISRRKPKDNPLACSVCGQPLRITDADGAELNQYWRLVDSDTPLALVIADKFKIVDFSTRQIADQWRKFERDLGKPGSPITPERVLAAADEYLRVRGENVGSACWGWIMSRCANKVARDSIRTPGEDPYRKRTVVE